MDQPTESLRPRPLAALGWAAFLAVSWTWCIGMFLPVILVRDYGTWAWVVFAVPNVVGAAAMGWVLQRPGASEQMVARHPAAMAAFSVVTILFHVLFVGWVVRWLGDWTFVYAAAGVAVVCFPLLLSRRVAMVLSTLVLTGSVAAFVVAVVGYAKFPVLPENDGGTLSRLGPLAAVCVFGFGLCPYLDLTFHRARQATSTFGAIAAFTIGFGAFFLAMIVFTLWYAPLAKPPEAGGDLHPAVPHVVALAIVAHMAGQAGFTVAAHGVEVARKLRAAAGGVRWGVSFGLLFGGGILVAAQLVARQGGYTPVYGLADGARTLSGQEMGYRLFMAFYGLLAPAYVWIVAMPWRDSLSTVKQRWWTFAIAVVAATPGYWVGFIEQEMLWLLAGVGVVLLARVVVEEVIARPRPG